MYALRSLLWSWNIVIWRGFLKSEGTTHQTFVLIETSWRRFEDVFCFCLHKTSSIRLQEEYICLTHTSSEDVYKTSWSRPICSSWSYFFRMSLRRFQVFKTSSRRLQDVLRRRLQDTLQKRLQDVFKTFSRHLQDVLQRCLQGVFKTYYQVKLFLLTQDVKTFSRRIQNVSKTYC